VISRFFVSFVSPYTLKSPDSSCEAPQLYASGNQETTRSRLFFLDIQAAYFQIFVFRISKTRIYQNCEKTAAWTCYFAQDSAPQDLCWKCLISGKPPAVPQPSCPPQDGLAQVCKRILANRPFQFSTARFTSCFSYIYSANRRIEIT
jgi:hypothetical protein